ncbi:MAG: sensor histidine kinase [Polyangia bacterium]
MPILVSAEPIPGGEITPPGAVVTFESISTLKALEQLRIEWNALIAHDLRQPLSSLDLNAQLVAEQTPKDSAVYKRIQQIRNQARRLNRMIQDLLDLSRLEARELTLTRRPVRLRELVREAAERIALEAPDRRIEVHVSGDPAEVDADADRIAQVMDNLLTNAVKYGEPGTPILVDVEARSDGVAVSVSNQGAGIAAEHLPTLFARFRRAEDAKRRGIKGIGLGLYIARALIEAHGGRIVAESTPGQLTTFRFTLPRSAPAAPALEAEQQPTAR